MSLGLCPNFRLARIKDCPANPWTATATRHSWTMSWTSGALPRMRCSKVGPLSDTTSKGMGVHPVRRIPKIPGANSKKYLDLVMEPVAISLMINLEGYTQRTRVW